MYKKNVKLYSLLIIIATLFLGVAYANVSSENLYINGDALIIPNQSINITSVVLKNSFGADNEVSKVLNKNKTMIQNMVSLNNNKDAFITYTVTIENSTDKDLYFIEVKKNDNFYKNENGEVNNQLIYLVNGINEYDKVDKNGGKISFDLTFKYDIEENEEIKEENQILNSYLNFRFREVYSITYTGFANNNYIDKLISGEEYTITFVDDIPSEVIVYGDASSSYIDGILTLKDIKSDIVILNKGDDT